MHGNGRLDRAGRRVRGSAPMARARLPPAVRSSSSSRSIVPASATTAPVFIGGRGRPFARRGGETGRRQVRAEPGECAPRDRHGPPRPHRARCPVKRPEASSSCAIANLIAVARRSATSGPRHRSPGRRVDHRVRIVSHQAAPPARRLVLETCRVLRQACPRSDHLQELEYPRPRREGPQDFAALRIDAHQFASRQAAIDPSRPARPRNAPCGSSGPDGAATTCRDGSSCVAAHPIDLRPHRNAAIPTARPGRTVT